MRKNIRKGKIAWKDMYKILICIVIIIILVSIIIMLKFFYKKDEYSENRSYSIIRLPETENDYKSMIIQEEKNVQIKDGVKRNVSQNVKNEKMYNNVTIKESTIETSGGISQLTAILENPYDKDIEG